MRFLLLAAVVAALAVAGCGGSSPSSTSSAGSGSAASSGGGSTSGGGTGALAADATSAKTGDIPDTQAFLVFSNPSAGYSMKYPEGWAQKGNGRDVTFQDKNNLVHVVVAPGPAPTVASVAAELRRLRAGNATLRAGAPAAVTIKGKPMVKVTYTTQSAPNPVTGKRVTLTVDRYALAHGGKVAVVELGTPKGVDNVDAYKMMIGSFTWR